MQRLKGLAGLRPVQDRIAAITTPPYDVIKPGTELEKLLQGNKDSLYHITLGKDPVVALEDLIARRVLKSDEEPCFYVYEQNYEGKKRVGVLSAAGVSEYAEGKIIRHEKTFDDKVRGRLALREKTGYTFEPVFFLTKAKIRSVLDDITGKITPVYQFCSDFAGHSTLHGVYNRIFRVQENSEEGMLIKKILSSSPLYIADGHHRYHASLLNRQSHCLAYICEAQDATIQAYNRVITGKVSFQKVKDTLDLEKCAGFKTPPKHSFAIYSREGCYLLKAQDVPDDVVGRLDCSILERELYPLLGLSHDLIMDDRHFDYFAESELENMVGLVDAGRYDIAVALHPVSSEELIAVADAGINDPDIIMPEKSTYFSPKLLSGIHIYKHIKKLN